MILLFAWQQSIEIFKLSVTLKLKCNQIIQILKILLHCVCDCYYYGINIYIKSVFIFSI